ncbi:LysR family transcriptional regulator [Paraburkholderia terrae]|uniref:LysR family transcriptional regulator n=1 Tax=Paraburkholderia terrae TaxID=311230 RepID=UPI0030E4D8EF
MDKWREMEVFVRIAELHSLSKAADSLDLSKPAASRHLAALEERLGARLVERSTRRLFLTDVGQSFFHRCKALLTEATEAESEVKATILDPVGTLRITASLSFCVKHITPLLPEYNRRYPNVTVHVEVANRYGDLIDSGIDIAIRTREYEPDSSITVRRLAQTRRILAASPHYLDRFGTPRSPEDLQAHRLLLYTLANQSHELHFLRGEQKMAVPVTGFFEANDGQVIRAAAMEGLGILVQPLYIIHADVVSGRLVPVLNDWDLPRLTINIAYLSRKHMSAKVRTFSDFLVAHFQQMEFERRWTA